MKMPGISIGPIPILIPVLVFLSNFGISMSNRPGISYGLNLPPGICIGISMVLSMEHYPLLFL